MRRLAKAVAVPLAILGLLLPAAASAEVGEAGFAFLKLGVGARPMAMGGAYVALADDPTALYWNPAGLGSVEGAQAALMHNEWIQDFKHEFAAVARSFRPGTAGLSISGFDSSSELEERDDVGNLTGHFGFNDIAVTGAFAHRFPHRITGGVGVKLIREMIAEETASAVAFDLGAKVGVGGSGVTLGAAIQNLGGEATFRTESFPLPRTFRAGAAVERAIGSTGKGILSAEIRQARGDDSRMHVGGEFGYKERVALRAGAKFGYDDESMSFGVGLTQHRFRFDYALVPFSSDLGTTHFFSVNARL